MAKPPKAKKPTTKPPLGEFVETTVSFDRDTLERLGHMAIDGDTTTRALIRQAVDEFLKRAERGAK